MSNYSTLKAAISAVIKENNNHEITGQVLQTTLLAMVDSLAGGYLFKGIATPATVVGTPDENVFYIGGGGVYSNFGATPVHVPDGCIGIFTYNGSFENHIIPTGGVFDISAYNAVGGTPTTYADLTAALGTNGANIPDYLRKGGMSVKFIQGSAHSSDNNYVKFFCTADEFTTDVTKWQGIDIIPSLNSKNIAESGGVKKDAVKSESKINSLIDGTGISAYSFDFNYGNGYIYRNGEIVSNNSQFSYSSPLFVRKHSIVVVYSQGTNIACISSCSSDGTNITPIKIGDSADSIETLEYTAVEDQYIIVSAKNVVMADYPPKVYLKAGVVKEITYNDIKDNFIIDGKYMDVDGNTANSSNCFISKPFFLHKGAIISIESAITGATLIAKANTFYTSPSTSYTKLNGVKNPSGNLYLYTVIEDGYYVVSARKADVVLSISDIVEKEKIDNYVSNVLSESFSSEAITYDTDGNLTFAYIILTTGDTGYVKIVRDTDGNATQAKLLCGLFTATIGITRNNGLVNEINID